MYVKSGAVSQISSNGDHVLVPSFDCCVTLLFYYGIYSQWTNRGLHHGTLRIKGNCWIGFASDIRYLKRFYELTSLER